MSPAIRASTEAAALAFAMVVLATATFYMVMIRSVPTGRVVVTAVGLGSVASVAVFIAVLALVSSRFPGKSPVLGAKRGAVIGVLAVVVVASVHSCFTFGSAGLLHSFLAQVGYACLVCGGPAAAFGAFFGRSLERRLFSAGGP
jgi:hypothetical protein